MALPIRIDKESGIPFYVQLADRIRLLIREGVLKSGDYLPTVRSLAVDLGINANTVARVYRDLQGEKLLRVERGVGTYVDQEVDGPVPKSDFESLEKMTFELIEQAMAAGMTSRELCQLVDTRWKEPVSDARQ
jgi:GntR family transcriptional regulator